MARSVDGQTSCFATTVVTDSGGGWNEAPCALADLIWRIFTAPRAAMKTAMANSIKNIRFFMMGKISVRARQTSGHPEQGQLQPTSSLRFSSRGGNRVASGQPFFILSEELRGNRSVEQVHSTHRRFAKDERRP